MTRVKTRLFWGDRFIPTAIFVGVGIWYLATDGRSQIKNDFSTFVVMCSIWLLCIAGTMVWVFASCTIDDNGIRVVNAIRHYRVSWDEIRRIRKSYDGPSRSNPKGKYLLNIDLKAGGTIYPSALTSRCMRRSQVQALIEIARRNGMTPEQVPDDLVRHFRDATDRPDLPDLPGDTYDW